MLQGDQYYIPFRLRNSQGIISDTNVSDVQITIGTLSKQMKDGVIYDHDPESWKFPITQKETFNMTAQSYPTQIRVKFNNGDIIGRKAGHISVLKSLSEEEI